MSVFFDGSAAHKRCFVARPIRTYSATSAHPGADFNGDGILDLAWVDSGDTASVKLGTNSERPSILLCLHNPGGSTTNPGRIAESPPLRVSCAPPGEVPYRSEDSAQSTTRQSREFLWEEILDSPEDFPMFQKFISMLNDCDDLQDVYHNADLPS